MRVSALWAVAASSIAIVAMQATPACAQDTTSAISGQITGEGGTAVPGATVTAVHNPTGTRQTVTTDSTGNYAMRGLPVGGPYTVTITAAGYPDQIIDNVSLTLGDTFGLPVQLVNAREVVVTGTRTPGARSLVTGSQSTFDAAQIQDIVSVRRDVRDIMRRDLLATYNANVGGVSIAGGNIRTQRFSVDGVQIQDSFGLNYGGLPSTRGIVSIEMIDQLSVKAAPFDVSEGNFQGGAVNVVLKSGTNQYHASAFGNFGGPSLTGKLTADIRGVVGDRYPVSTTKILDFTNYGGAVSGHIIKDKLFFFAAYEHLTEGTPAPFGVTGSSAPTPIPGLTQAQVDNTTALFNSAGYDKYQIGGIPDAIAEVDKKWAAKVDWNIMDGQRLTASYIHHENVIPNFGSAGSNSATTPYIALQSDIYRLTEFTNAFAAQLNSKWSDAFSTELRASYKYYRRGQDPYNGPDYAQFNVCQDGTSSTPLGTAVTTAETICGSGVPIIRLGPDTPRQANAFNQQILNLQGNATLRQGNHSIKAEFDHLHSKLYNLFVYGGGGLAGSGGPNGLYYFDSTADFSTRTANELVATSTTVGPKTNGYVAWAYAVNTAALQDTWTPSNRFKVNAGVRFDFYTADRTIQRNQNFVSRYAVLYPGLSNTATLNGRYKVQPRIGANWAITDTVRLTGGAGLFAGGLSDVFISNNYSNSGTAINGTGTAITSVDLVRLASVGGATQCVDRSTGASSLAPGTSGLTSAICGAALNNISGSAIAPSVISYLQGNTGVLANTITNSLDPHFKLPAQWKYNASLSWTPQFENQSWLFQGWTARVDGLLSVAQQAVRWVDLRAQPLVVNGVVQVAPDGRPRYGGTFQTATGTYTPGSNYDIQLTNTDKGRALVIAGGLTKRNKDLDFTVAYTRQNVKDVAGILVSSTVGSSYGGIPTSDPNSGGDYGRSTFEVRNTYRATIDFHHKFFGDAETRFGINFERRSGQPYSATMFDNSVTGTGCNGNGRACVFGTAQNTSSHLLYVPNFGLTPTTTGLPAGQVQYGNVIFADAATLAAMQALVNGTQLRNYQGRIAPKNLLTGPAYNKVDLNFAQQIPFFYSKVTVVASLENFLNLLNRDWGSYYDISNTAVVRVACSGATTNGQTCPNYVYSVYNAPKTSFSQPSVIKASLWALRLGARIDF